MFTTLISVADLQLLHGQASPLRVFDVSFDLMNPQAGREQYLQAHIPGAIHADIDQNLSAKGAPDAASGGRHPLPSREAFAAWLGSTGLTRDHQVVVYDRQGANYCGRLWWMLKWVGHEAVAVLDGGLQAWQAAGLPVSAGPQTPPAPSAFPVAPPLASLVNATGLQASLGHGTYTVIDARATPRFRGEVEPLDPVAGHIPGALNRPFTQNLQASGLFKTADELRQEFTSLLGQRDPAAVVHQCGSGVSAIPNLLAMEVAGLGRSALYAGSWSDWCSDPCRPVARG